MGTVAVSAIRLSVCPSVCHSPVYKSAPAVAQIRFRRVSSAQLFMTASYWISSVVSLAQCLNTSAVCVHYHVDVIRGQSVYMATNSPSSDSTYRCICASCRNCSRWHNHFFGLWGRRHGWVLPRISSNCCILVVFSSFDRYRVILHGGVYEWTLHDNDSETASSTLPTSYRQWNAFNIPLSHTESQILTVK